MYNTYLVEGLSQILTLYSYSKSVGRSVGGVFREEVSTLVVSYIVECTIGWWMVDGECLIIKYYYAFLPKKKKSPGGTDT